MAAPDLIIQRGLKKELTAAPAEERKSGLPRTDESHVLRAQCHAKQLLSD
jgi:hypothetical protein